MAPLGVLEKDDGWAKIQLSKEQIEQNLKSLQTHPEFTERVQKIIGERPEFPPAVDPESALYDGFMDDRDRKLCEVVRNNGAKDLANFHPPFSDERLPDLLLHYKAKNYPESLAADEVEQWEKYRIARLGRQAPKFMAELTNIQKDLAADKPWAGKSVEDCAYLVEELMLWYESLQPGDY